MPVAWVQLVLVGQSVHDFKISYKLLDRIPSGPLTFPEALIWMDLHETYHRTQWLFRVEFNHVKCLSIICHTADDFDSAVSLIISNIAAGRHGTECPQNNKTSVCLSTCYFLSGKLRVLVARSGNGLFDCTVSLHALLSDVVGRFC